MEKGPMTLRELKRYIRSDLRYVNGHPYRAFFSRFFFEPGFKYCFWLRCTRFFFLKGKLAIIPFVICRMILKHYGYKYSFDISFQAQIGAGLTIAHYGYIIVPSNAVMGEGCTLRPGVVFGKKLTSSTGGASVGSNVDFGVGTTIIGDVRIGNNVVVGANSVVTKDIPDGSVIAGSPARIIRSLDEEH